MRLLQERLADALRDAADHLAVDDQRIDHPTAILDHQIAQDRDRAGADIHLDHRGVQAVGEAARIGRAIAARRLEPRIDFVGEFLRLVISDAGDLGEAHLPVRIAAQHHRAIDIVDRVRRLLIMCAAIGIAFRFTSPHARIVAPPA